MNVQQIKDVQRSAEAAGERYREFFRAESVSVGLYRLRAGEDDAQQPHGEDEVYYVLSGKSRFELGNELFEVQAGSVLYVAAGLAHKFVEISEDLELLVFFAPAEGS